MSERLEVELHSRHQAWAIIKAQVFPFLATVLQGGGKWVMTITRRKRTQKQNRRYFGNGVLKQIADQAVVNGKRYSPEVWHEYAKKKFIGVVELPDGSLIGETSTKLTTKEFCEFCDQVEAWAATELSVVFYDLSPRDE